MVSFNANCRLCPRLAGFLEQLKTEKPDYVNAPVDAFGDNQPKLMIVGLAPGMHGANRTGRPFTGDDSGKLLYQTLFDLGLSSQPRSKGTSDELILHGVRITNAVKCLPPQNKPTTAEIKNCSAYLIDEIKSLPDSCNLLALGKLAHDAIVRASGLKLSSLKFAHAAVHQLPDGRRFIDSYHCSRYNTQTGRLTREMFHDVIKLALA